MRASILILSEDSAKDAHATVCVLARRMLRLIQPDYVENDVVFLPLGAESADAQRAVQGNRWDSRDARGQTWRIALIRTLATRVLAGENSFVFYHIDGDQPWKERKRSEKLSKFERFRDEIARHAEALKQDMDPVEIRAAVRDRLQLLTPFYCIEAWLYQNTEQAITLCIRHYQGRHRDRFEQWGQDRELLDEVVKPKEQVELAGKHNCELAKQGFPSQAVYAAGKSFAATVDRLKACQGLVKVLQPAWQAAALAPSVSKG